MTETTGADCSAPHLRQHHTVAAQAFSALPSFLGPAAARRSPLGSNARDTSRHSICVVVVERGATWPAPLFATMSQRNHMVVVVQQTRESEHRLCERLSWRLAARSGQ
jgi:hypothetical protein